MKKVLVVLIVSTFLSTGANAGNRPDYDDDSGYAINDPDSHAGPHPAFSTEPFSFNDVWRERIEQEQKMKEAIEKTWPGRNPTGPMPAYPNNGQASPREPLPNNPSRTRLHFPLPKNHPLRHPDERQIIEKPFGFIDTYLGPKPWRYTEEELRQRSITVNDNNPEMPRTSGSMPVPPMPHSPVVMP